MMANSSEHSRQAILNILLHPQVRSFRVRAALGKRDWQSISSDLDFKSLDIDVPDVFATYYIQGQPWPNLSILYQRMEYCGAGSLALRLLTPPSSKLPANEYHPSDRFNLSLSLYAQNNRNI
jgi:hypothetical protein